MILIDVQVPLLNRTYDFELDEEMTAGDLIVKIAGILAKAEDMTCQTAEEMQLYAFSHEKVLDRLCSLKQQGVKSGERLCLI